jgi:CxxC motif-containing protein (DUF1111 family)
LRGFAVGLLCLLVLACGNTGAATVAREPGQPLPALDDARAGRFLLGKAVFERLVVPDEGLGPLFNAERCSSCHDVPAAGGTGNLLVTKATRYENGECSLLEAEGGDNIQQRATPLLSAHGIHNEKVPASATARSLATAPPLFGLGLIEGIPEKEILSRRDENDADGDGISGRAGSAADGTLGRFSRKSDIATLEGFIDTALRFEIGLTTPAHPVEETVNGQPLPADADPAPDPEIGADGIALLADFIRYLAPPVREIVSGAASDTVIRGERVFDRLRCAACHTPTMRTGRSEAASLDRVHADLYSDLLLHDMGEDMADVCGHGASPSEWRTAPLWGLRFRARFMHDARASSPHAAILAHGGEARTARDAFDALPADAKRDLLRFLATL